MGILLSPGTNLVPMRTSHFGTIMYIKVMVTESVLHLMKICNFAFTIKIFVVVCDRLCGLVVRVLGYRSGGPGSIPGTTRKKK
jgi:hypothetical protein